MAHSHFPRHDFGEDRSPRRRARVITACVLAAVLAGAASYAVWLTATGSGEPATAKGPTVANGSVVAAPVVTPKMKEVSFWKPATKMSVRRYSDDVPLELGTRFTVSRNGWVAGIRFYKASGEKGRHTGSLWDADGNRLAKVTFTDETATGWQEAHFDEPAMVAADHVYTVSYHSENGVYVGKPRATSLRSGPLASEADKTGVYRYGKGGGFPTRWNPKNYTYYVDVIYRWLDGGPEPTPTPVKPTPTPRKTPSKSPSPTAPKPPVEARGGNCPAFPTPTCTGVPAGKKLRTLASNMSGDTYRVTKSGTVLDGVHVSGTLLITAADVTVKNSLIDGDVKNEYDRKIYPFTIADSTIGPESGCDSTPGLWNAEFTASRVHIRNHVDGVSVSGDNVKIRDSFIILCSHSGDHSDGIQTVGRGDGLVFDHNTVDQSDAPDHTAPVFLVDPSTGVSVTNNLLIGGTYTIRLRASDGTVAKNNLVVNKSWDYGPSDSDCGNTAWSGNKLVTIDRQYRVTSTIGSLACEG